MQYIVLNKYFYFKKKITAVLAENRIGNALLTPKNRVATLAAGPPIHHNSGHSLPASNAPRTSHIATPLAHSLFYTF